MINDYNSRIQQLNDRWAVLSSDLCQAELKLVELNDQLIDTGHELRQAKTEAVIRPCKKAQDALASLGAEQLAISDQIKNTQSVIGDIQKALPCLKDEIDGCRQRQMLESKARLLPIANELLPEALAAFRIAAAQLTVIQGIIHGCPHTTVMPEHILRPLIRRDLAFTAEMDRFVEELRTTHKLEGNVTI